MLRDWIRFGWGREGGLRRQDNDIRRADAMRAQSTHPSQS